MPAAVRFYWNPDPIVHAQAIERVRLSLLDRTPPLLAAREAVQADIRERFETETDPSGQPWEPWAPSYEPVAREYPNEGILTQSGMLKEVASSSRAVRITNDTVFYETGFLPHFGLAHEEGLPDRKNPLPQRSFLGMSDEARTVIFASFAEWFDRSIDLFVTARGRIGRRHALRGVRGQFIPRSSVGLGALR